MADHCHRCQAGLGTLTQGVLPGAGKALLCPACERNETASHYVAMMPTPGERGWDAMREKDQALVTSVRRTLAGGNGVTEAQFNWLADIYERTNR